MFSSFVLSNTATCIEGKEDSFMNTTRRRWVALEPFVPPSFYGVASFFVYTASINCWTIGFIAKWFSWVRIVHLDRLIQVSVKLLCVHFVLFLYMLYVFQYVETVYPSQCSSHSTESQTDAIYTGCQWKYIVHVETVGWEEKVERSRNELCDRDIHTSRLYIGFDFHGPLHHFASFARPRTT